MQILLWRRTYRLCTSPSLIVSCCNNLVARLTPVDELYSESEKYFDYRRSLHQIMARTLIIVGDQDWICPPSQSKIMSESIPQAQLKVFVGANHSVHIEKNDEVIATIQAWINDD